MSDAYYRGEPRRIGTETQLLLDDVMVEDRWRLHRVIRQPDKHPANPIFTRSKPWEGDSVGHPTVLWDEEYGRYRMWYGTSSSTAYHGAGGPANALCYAESDDGVEWEKPLVGMRDFLGHAETNVLYVGAYHAETTRHYGSATAQIYKDRDEPDPDRRYKMITYEPFPIDGQYLNGVGLAYSPDGIRWSLSPGPPILDHNSDTGNHVVYDERAGRWLLFIRPTCMNAVGWAKGTPFPPRLPAKINIKRRIAVMTSEDLAEWTYPRTVMYPDERDRSDYDWERAFRYGSHILFLYGGMDGLTDQIEDVYLASSEDGFRWERFHTREPFLPRGREWQWDAGQVIVNAPPVAQGEDLLFYYYGSSRGQADYSTFVGGVGLALAKRDRFVEQRADDETGFLLSREFVLEGNRLRVNTSFRWQRNKQQYLRAEICRHPAIGEHYGFAQAFDGFSREDSDPVCTDRTDALMTWRGNADLGPLRGKPVYIRFELRNVGLYSFRITEE